MRRLVGMALIGAMLLSWAACRAKSPVAGNPSGNSSTPAAVTPEVLLIGNSYTSFNGGVDQLLNGLKGARVAVEIAPGGYTLQRHWNTAATLDAIKSGKFRFVILQEQSQLPAINGTEFSEYAGKLNEVVKAAGAQTVLFMTWQRPDSIAAGVTTENLAEAYTQAGSELDVKVAPAGLAFAKAVQQRPELSLNASDGHPTLAGSYLAACVIYRTVYGTTPVGLSFSGGLDDGEKTFLQRVANETVDDYAGKRSEQVAPNARR